MKASRVVNVNTRDRRNLCGFYDLGSGKIVKTETDYNESSNTERATRNVRCQCSIKRDLMCTCGNLACLGPRYISVPKQVYRYADCGSFPEVGVGSIKALPRRRVRKIYLSETTDKAVGSLDLSSYMNQRTTRRRADSCYDDKRTLSKCVGVYLEDDKVFPVNNKLSPNIKKKSVVTSPNYGSLNEPKIYKGSYNVYKTTTIPKQANDNDVSLNPKCNETVSSNRTKNKQTTNHTLLPDATITKDILPTFVDNLKSGIVDNNTDNYKDFSSDSFVQHVHNLENSSDEKQSNMSFNPMEDKVEKEYKKIFNSKSKDRPSIEKPMPNLKSASVVKRRFEALRRGLAKKETKKESLIISETSSRIIQSHKDVSTTIDSPSLKGRLYFNTKVCTPLRSTDDYKVQQKFSSMKSLKVKKKQGKRQCSTDVVDSNERVPGICKLRGKKCDCNQSYSKTLPTVSKDLKENQKQQLKSEYPVQEIPKKKQRKKFFFFPRKNKEKESKPLKVKKEVTAGRCEVKDGLVIKMGCVNEQHVKETFEKRKHVDEYENFSHEAWLEKIITKAGNSRNSVHIRWNNKMYATSSSTVLELMDSVYKYTGIDIRSRSEIKAGESTKNRSNTKSRDYYLQQDIEAWMIPKMITHVQKQTIAKAENIEKCPKDVSKIISYNRTFVNASQDLPGYLELVLQSQPNINPEYIIINLPKVYFSSSDETTKSSDEEIYKIVEYETPELKKRKVNRQMATGDAVKKIIKVAVGVQKDNKKDDIESKTSCIVAKNSLIRRDVAIQDSNVFPKRCDVIGVQIITQREIRDERKPILKLEDELSDEESENNIVIQKNCELAESFLQDYCHIWMPSDLFSWHISGSEPHSSDNNSIESLSQGDCTKSCPNMYNDFQEKLPTIVISSCETSCSHCIALERERRKEESLKYKILSRFKKKCSEVPQKPIKREAPKDSLEVYRKRMFYASTEQKSKWNNAVNSEMSSDECPKKAKPCWKVTEGSFKKKLKQKHVLFPGCEEMSKLAAKLSNKSLEGILSYKGSGCNQKESQSPQHTEVLPKSEDPASCKEKKPCTKNWPHCDDSNQNTSCESTPPCDNQNMGPPNTPVCNKPRKMPCSSSSSDLSETKHSCKEKDPCVKKNSPPCDDLVHNTNRECISPCDKPNMGPQNAPSGCNKPKKMPCTSSNTDLSKTQYSCNKQSPLPNRPSREFGLGLKTSPKSSQDSIPKKSKDCAPNCANRKKLYPNLMVPPPPPPTACPMPLLPPTECPTNKPKILGLYLRKLPYKKKTCSDDSVNWNSEGSDVLRLNSIENVTIRLQKEIPYTEEIREGLNIKVQDEDGQTLYERIDYKKSGDKNKCALLKDMYKDHQVHRVSTTTTIVQDAIEHNQAEVKKSDTSIDNLIEINFTLKLKQGDKAIYDIKNGSDMEIKQNKVVQSTESKKDIFIVQDRAERALVTDTKKDVNIKIVIKNYNNDLEKPNVIETSNDNFTKRICGKFQTVSTGYSDVIDHNSFSVHRATVDLTTSTDRIFIEPCRCENNELIKNAPEISSHSLIEPTKTEKTAKSVKYCNKEENVMYRAKNSFKNNDENLTETDNKSKKHSKDKSKLFDTFDESSNDSILYKNLRDKAEKKEMLRKLLKANLSKKPENKNIKEIVRARLSSDISLNEDIALTSNELAKELTYASLDPKCFKDTDSMNNYLIDSLLSVNENPNEKFYPTKTNSECSENESFVSGDSKLQGCLCSKFATKLNLTKNCDTKDGCCCGKSIQKDVETVFDFLNLKPSIDNKTQCPNISSKINSTNAHSKKQSLIITDASVTVEKNIDKEHITSKDIDECFSKLSDANNVISCGIKRFERETIFGLSDDEILVFTSNLIEESNSGSYKNKILRRKNSKKVTTDILQLNEMKKAVLEIYAEKIISNGGERIVAKLPKFDLEAENDITNYKEAVKSKKRINKRNIVMMSVKQ